MLALAMAAANISSYQTGAVLRAALVAALTTAGAALIGMELEAWVSTRGVALVFIVAVVLCASRFGFVSGILSAVFSFLALNFFFIEPRYSFQIADQKELFSLSVFLAVAAITGSLAGRMREQADNAHRRADMLQILSDFSARLFSAKSEEEILRALTEQSSKAIDGPAALFHQNGETHVVEAVAPLDLIIDLSEAQNAEQVFRKGHPVMATARGWAGGRFEYRFIDRARLPDRVIALAPSGGNTSVAPDAEQVLTALMEQASLGVQRFRLARETQAANLAAQEEKLRSTLLSSVSHDLRTPLATILGSITSLRELGGKMSKADRDELLGAIEAETRRLSRLVANLLDMTRLESGLTLRRDQVDLEEIISSSAAAIAASFPARRIDLSLENAPKLRSDASLLGQVIYNLLENAIKFSPPESAVGVSAAEQGNSAEIRVVDQGGGIKPANLTRIFDKFFTSGQGPAGREGAGLGLAIAKGIVVQLGGTLTAVSPGAGGIGSEFVIVLPLGGGAAEEAGA